MSMIEDMFERCVTLLRYPGDEEVDADWREGGVFDAAILKDSEAVAAEGQRQVLREGFIAVVRKGVVLRFHSVFRRLSDGAVFRVTGDVADAAAPEASTIPIARVRCERWELP